MKKLLFLLLVLTACSQSKDPDWKLVWSDEFNYRDYLIRKTGEMKSDLSEIMSFSIIHPERIENSVIHDGNLLIIGRKEPYDSAEYTSASLTTDGKHSWTYGKIEARMKLPKGQGIWPAFWMLGQNIHQVGWPRCGEIDIMEHINNEDILYGTLHWHNEKHVSSGAKIPCACDQYHNYSRLNGIDSIKWFLDGAKYHGVCIKDSINSTSEFHKPHYIILNLAIGGDWPKNPDEITQFPDTVFVDYVRVYQK